MESIKTSQELYEHVMSEYKKYNTELNSLFFDFPVHMSKSDILVTYEHLQHDIFCKGINKKRVSDLGTLFIYLPKLGIFLCRYYCFAILFRSRYRNFCSFSSIRCHPAWTYQALYNNQNLQVSFYVCKT